MFYWQRFLDLYLIVLITWFLRRLCFLSFLFSKPLWYFHKTGNVRYIDNFQMIQIFKNSKKIKEFDYFDCFDCAIILIIWEVLKTSYLNEDFLTFIWLFSLLDFLVVFAFYLICFLTNWQLPNNSNIQKFKKKSKSLIILIIRLFFPTNSCCSKKNLTHRQTR